jgi:hypothetical protein
MSCTLHHYADGSGCLIVDAKDNPGMSILTLHVPYAVITEFMTCLTLDPTTWHTRPGWVRSPRPFQQTYEGGLPDFDTYMHAEDDRRYQWFAGIYDELVAACVRTFADA